ncbi:class I SAM-dependent methyltransferase [Roseateles sp.]|uniref:class I SAM-dependent methyltransferase n=1 Tax=Roseateles sp. TaxID=1971397 RepID=UPI0025F84710|nr:class I SAM-dependent methyltransferase [Roseateles sp.]MBV8033822.1 class I SAM-dependent methyltransferase [Roseateles sp.]
MRRSFRDPAGQLEDDGRQVRRIVHPAAREATEVLLASPLYAELVRDGLLIPASQVAPSPDGGLLIEHPRIEIPSYPFEWTPAMLLDAALLTLDVQARAWVAGWTLKDAAANNVLFDGTRPVLCDLLSLQKRTPDDTPGWLAYGQFVRHFVLPLLAIAEQGRTPRDIFLAHRDGLRAAELAPFIPWHSQFGLAMWLHVRLPARLERRRIASNTAKPGSGQPDARRPAADGTPWLIGNLRAFVQRLGRGGTAVSTWSAYTGNRDHYADAELNAKRGAVQALVDRLAPRRVLDIGANSGEFSLLAARAGAQVLALDDDINALDELHRGLRGQNTSIQCLHANFARPTPATGWRLAETLSLPARLEGRFDLVLMLAVIHHLAVTERVPLVQLFESLADCCSGMLLLEFVPRDDPRFVEIAGANAALYQDWSRENLLDAAAPWFGLQSETTISSHRTLLQLLRR